MEKGEGDNKRHSGRPIHSASFTEEEEREEIKRRISINTKWPYIGDWFYTDRITRVAHFCYNGILHSLRDDTYCIYCGEAIPEGIKVAFEVIRSYDV